MRNIDPKIGYYLAGFADGEGSFNVSIKKRADHNLGWQVVLSFNVSQKESFILSQFKKHLNCGRLNQRKIDGLYSYTVNNPLAIKEIIIPFFEKFSFLSQTKRKNFSIFKQIAKIVFEKKHLSDDGFKRIITLREKLNAGRGRKRKYQINDIMPTVKENPQRLHAKPRAFRREARRKI